MNQPEDIAMIYKGKLSLAEALKELEIVKKSFEISERIEARLSQQDTILIDLQSKGENFASYSYVNSRIEDAKSQMTKIIKDKFEELSVSYFTQLNEKISRNEIENFVSNRCTWVAFNSLTQNVSSLKSRFDKHIFSDFEGLKTKMKVQFGDKYTELMNMTTNVREEFSQIKMRISVLEQKIQEMFVDDGLGDSEDYDSQEENDNIMQNLGARDSLESEESEVVNDVGKAEPEKPVAKGTEMKSEENKNNQVTEETLEVKPAEVTIVKTEEKKVEEVKTEPKSEVLNPIVQEKKEFNEKVEVAKIEEPKKEEKKIEEPKKEEKKIEEPKKEPTRKYEVKIEEVKQEEFIQSNAEEVKKSDPDKLSADKAPVLEIPDKPHRRRDDDAGSSRHRRGGSSAGDALSRKNSMSSAGGGGVGAAGMGGLRGVNKKLGVLQKDLETFKSSLDENKATFDEIRSEIGKIYDKISNVRNRCEEIENIRQGMEISFIKALRRSGKDKKAPAKPVESLSSKDLKKIFDQIHEKTKKITTVETMMDKVALDMKFVKTNFQEKINEIVQAIRGFENFRKDSTKESTIFDSKLKELESKLNIFGSSIVNEFEIIKGPMTDLISDQQREKEILEENLRRQRQSFNEIIEECSLSMKNFNTDSLIQSRITTTRPRTRKSNESPKVSVKHKFFETNNTFRVSNPPLKTEENWLLGFPDGKTLALPKVGIKKSKASLTGEDLRKSL